MDINIGSLCGNSPEHQHKFCEIIVCTQGEGIFRTTDTLIGFKKGTIIIVPPETPHSTYSENAFERIFINGKLDWILDVKKSVILSEDADSDGLVLSKMIYRDRFKNHEYVMSLINAFTSYILHKIELDSKIDLAVSSVISEITESFFDCNLQLNSVLNKSGYAEDYIRSVFKKTTGKTPVEFLTEIRINHSRLLIDMYKSSLSLSEIAEKCGFTDYVYFSRRFKKLTGMSPREYAKTN